MLHDGEPAEPLDADVVLAFLKAKPRPAPTVIQIGDNRLGERDGARLNRVASELATLDEDLRKDIERMFLMPAVGPFEMRPDEG